MMCRWAGRWLQILLGWQVHAFSFVEFVCQTLQKGNGFSGLPADAAYVGAPSIPQQCMQKPPPQQQQQSYHRDTSRDEDCCSPESGIGMTISSGCHLCPRALKHTIKKMKNVKQIVRRFRGNPPLPSSWKRWHTRRIAVELQFLSM